MRLKSPDLLVVLFIIVLTLILSLSGLRGENIEYETMPIWMAPLGILMVLFIPGYAVVSAVLPKVGSEKTLLLSLGISISISAVGGLVLNLTPWGLTPITRTLWLSTISLIGVILAWRQRINIAHTFEMGVPSLQKENIIIFGLAGLILFCSVSIAYISSKQKETTFVQLWAIPSVTAQGEYQIQIGIRNEEKQSETYDLYIEVDGRRLEETPTILIDANGEWTTVFKLSEKPSQTIRISLYRTDDMLNSYRWLRISPDAFK